MHPLFKLLKLYRKQNERIMAEAIVEERISSRELRRRQNAERASRAKRLAELVTPQVLKQLEAEGRHVTDLLPPPKWVIRPYDGDFDLTME